MSVTSTDTIDQRKHRRAASLKIRSLADIEEFPHLKYWNYEPCAFHKVPTPGCEYRRCGGELFKHQRVGVMWLYAVKQGILADMTGLGKTNQIIALACFMKQRGELTDRMVIVCPASAVGQWQEEFERFAPSLSVVGATGTVRERALTYQTNWDVCVMSSSIMLRDASTLHALEVAVYVADDVDPLRNARNRTTQAYNRLARNADRVININATPLQIRLEELYSTTVSVGGYSVFGGQGKFDRHYVRREPVAEYTKAGRKIVVTKVIGYKNMTEFKEKIAPMYLRRTYDDVDDIAIPAIAPPENVWLDLHPAQRTKYTELQAGVLRLMSDSGESIKRVEAITKFNYGQMICAGLPALGEEDGPQASVKLDWLVDKLTGDWVEQKVVVFIRNTGTIRALGARLRALGIQMALIWGEMPQEQRQAQQRRFWDDPTCRVIVGTSAMERSLNLQISNVVVFLDLPALNPARVMQILGRVRRIGSKHSHVYSFILLAHDTQEERSLDVLEQRQALADYVFDEGSEFFEALSPLELLSLISP